MKKLLSAIALSFVTFAGPVAAADVPLSVPVKAPPAVVPSPIFSWNGFYAGIHGGYGWEQGTLDTGDTRRLNGLVAGGQVGFNYLIGSQWFVGAEIDSAYAAIKNATIIVDSGFPHSTASDFEQNKYLGSARLRTGIAMDRYLIFVTGGGAWLLNNMQIGHNGLTSAAGAVILTDQHLHTGWTAGGGIETVLAGNWTARFEYLFARLGRETYAFDQPQPFGLRIDAQLVRFGLNYFFK